jgi:hypothetical protein
MPRAERWHASRGKLRGHRLFGSLGGKERAKEWISRPFIIKRDDAMIQYNIACGLALINEPNQALDLLESSASRMSASVIVNCLKKNETTLRASAVILASRL